MNGTDGNTASIGAYGLALALIMGVAVLFTIQDPAGRAQREQSSEIQRNALASNSDSCSAFLPASDLPDLW